MLRFLRFRAYLREPIPEPVQMFLETIPGVCARKAPYLHPRSKTPPFTPGLSIDAPIDAVTPLLEHLRGFGVTPERTETYSWAVLPAEGTEDRRAWENMVKDLSDLQEVKQEVKDRAYPFQRVGFTRGQTSGGGLFHWECGAGKTILGVCLASGDPGMTPLPSPDIPAPKWPKRRIVVVTLATTTYQWDSVIRDTTLPGSLPTRVLATESSNWVRPTPAPKPCLRVCAPEEEWTARWLYANPKGVSAFLVESVAPPVGAPKLRKGMIPPESGDLLTKAEFARWEDWVVAAPVLPDEVIDLFDRIHEYQNPDTAIVTRSAIPRKYLPNLLASGILEEFTPAQDSLFQVINEDTGQPVAAFDGRGALSLPHKELAAVQAVMHAAETKDRDRIEARVVVAAALGTSPEDTATGIGIDLEDVLRIRAKAMATQEAARRSRVCSLDETTQVCILCWQLLPARRDFLRSWQPTTIIYDESQWAKSKDVWTIESDGFGNDKWIYAATISASAHYLVEGLSHVGPCPRVAELTATPAPDKVRDWWSQMQILTRGFGKYRTFTDRYCDGRMDQINEHLTIYNDKGVSRPGELNERLSFWIHRVEKTEMERYLPPLTRTITRLPADVLARVTIPQSEWQAAKARGAQGLQELHQMHAASCKRPFIVQRAIEHLQAGLKVVVFSGRILDCNLTFQEIQKALPKVPAWCIHGESKIQGPFGAYLRDFGRAWMTREGPCILIGTEDVWGTGVDGLQSTHKALRAALPITPLEWEQPEGRFDRAIPPNLPQISTDIEYFWASGTIDDRIMALFQDKMGTVSTTYGKLGGKMRDVVAQFGGSDSEEEAMQKLAETLTDGLPEGAFEGWEADD